MTRNALLLTLTTACTAAPKPVTPEDCSVELSATEVVNAFTLNWSATSETTAAITWVAGSDPEQSLELTEASMDHEVTLVGLPAESEIVYSVVQSDGSGCEGSFQTEVLPDGLPSLVVNRYDAELASSEPYLLGAAMAIDDRNAAFLLDRQGGWRWYSMDPPEYQGAQASMELGSNRVLYTRFDAKHAQDLSSIQVRGLDGTVYDERVTTGAHHFFRQLEDGSIGYLATDIRGWRDPETGEDLQVVGDALTVLSPDGELKTIFSVWDHLEVEKGSEWDRGFFAGAQDWTHGNALDYDATSDTWLISLGGIDSLLLVSGEGALLDTINEDTYTFVGADPIVFQHDAHWTADGTILLLSHNESATAAVEWERDEEARTMTAVWSYQDGTRASGLGQARELENGNVMVNFGGFGTIREVTRDGQIAWEAQAREGYFFGNGEMVTDLYAGL